MLSGEMNARMSREMETMMDLMQSQISSAISSAISESIIPEIQNMVENLPLSQPGAGPCMSSNEDGMRNVWKSSNTKLTKKDSRSACDLRDHVDPVPYNCLQSTAFLELGSYKVIPLSLALAPHVFYASKADWPVDCHKRNSTFFCSVFVTF